MKQDIQSPAAWRKFSAHLRSYLQPPMSRKADLGLIISAIGFYMLGALLIFPFDSDVAVVMSALPVAVTGWRLGMRAGLSAALLFVLIGFLLNALAGLAAPLPHDVADAIVLVGIGIMVGQLHDTAKLLKRELEERIQAEAALASERRLLFTLIDSLPDWIYMKGRQGQYLLCNQAFAHALGAVAPREVVGKALADFAPSELIIANDAADQSVLETGQPLLHGEEKCAGLDSHHQWISVSKVPLDDANGAAIGVISLTRDITVQKLAEAQQIALRLEQERGVLLKQFVDDVSHDFRTNLTIIRSSADLVGRYSEREDQRRHLAKIDAGVSRMENLLEEFMTVARLDAERVQVEASSIDLNSLVQSAVLRCLPIAIEKKHQVDFQLADDIPMLHGNEAELIRAIQNVFMNSVKFTPDQGEITVKTHEEDTCAVIEVSDNGIGVSPEAITRIFDPLYKADASRNTETGGAGLGLTIAKQIIEAHGGTIRAKSEVGAGTTVIMTFPAHST